MDSINLDYDRDKRQTLVNAVVNLRNPLKARQRTEGAVAMLINYTTDKHRNPRYKCSQFSTVTDPACVVQRARTVWRPHGQDEALYTSRVKRLVLKVLIAWGLAPSSWLSHISPIIMCCNYSSPLVTRCTRGSTVKVAGRNIFLFL